MNLSHTIFVAFICAFGFFSVCTAENKASTKGSTSSGSAAAKGSAPSGSAAFVDELKKAVEASKNRREAAGTYSEKAIESTGTGTKKLGEDKKPTPGAGFLHPDFKDPLQDAAAKKAHLDELNAAVNKSVEGRKAAGTYSEKAIESEGTRKP